jgi:hypothetical protein
MRPTQGRAATKNQLQWPRLERCNCRQRPYDLEILLDKRRTGQPEMRLGFEQVLDVDVTVQGSAPHSCTGAVAKSGP